MRRSLGTAVFSGMLGVTAFGIFLTPVFFYTVSWLSERRLFTSAAVEWLGSPLLGGLIGAVIGYLLALLHIGRLPSGSGLRRRARRHAGAGHSRVLATHSGTTGGT